MVVRVVPSAVVIVLTAVMLTGCGRQAAQEPLPDLSLLARGPDRQSLPAPRPFLSAAFDAAGGLAAWEFCHKIAFRATVTACESNGCFYLTEHDFVLYPWSDAIQVTTREPRADFTWQVVGAEYRASQADPNLDVSPLKGWHRDYAEAVLQIATAPVRMLENDATLTLAPAAVQIAGQWYLPIDAKYEAAPAAPKENAAAEPYWTQDIYYQSQSRSFVDMIWLGNSAHQRYIIVRGYDYAGIRDNGVLIPTKIEVFQSGPEANFGPRLALIDLKR
jgi:hypothetical protein